MTMRDSKVTGYLGLDGHNRQSLVVSLAGKDCKVTVYYAPSADTWYADLDVPVNTPAVRGRRLANGGGILPRASAALPGNIYVRPVSDFDARRDPHGADAFAPPTPRYRLAWEAA